MTWLYVFIYIELGENVIFYPTKYFEIISWVSLELFSEERDSSLRIGKSMVYRALIWDVKDVYSYLFLAHPPSFSVVGRHSQQNSLNFHSELFYFIKITECSLKQGYKLCFSQIPSECLTSPSSFWTAEFPCLSCLMNVLLVAKKPTQYSFGLLTTYQAPWFKYLCEKKYFPHWLCWPQATDFFVYLFFFPHSSFEK